MDEENVERMCVAHMEFARLIARAMGEVFISPNEIDRNGEHANLVDGIFDVARAIRSLAATMQEIADKIKDQNGHQIS